MKTLVAKLVAFLGVGLAVAGLIGLAARPQPTAGDPDTLVRALDPSESATTTTSVGGPDSPAGVGAPDKPVGVENGDPELIEPNQVSSIENLASARTAVPVRLLIEAIGVDAPITQAGIDGRTGQMEIPDNVSDVAWYKHGPAPDEPGSAVLAAHVDLASQGRGVFFDLGKLEPGDEVGVQFGNGDSEWFVVVARTIYDKEELPLHSVFSREGPPVLTLITCGGGFNSTSQSYDSNVVVYATPLETAPPSAEPA